MPVYQIDVEKIIGIETWTNVYHVSVADIATARARATSIKDLERPVHGTNVTFVATRTRQQGVGQVGIIDLVAQLGTRTIAGNTMPLFNCARVDFANGTRRPARKYLRGGFGGTDLQGSFAHSSGFLTALGVYADGILALGGICDPQGRALTARSVITAIAMHQLRRGNRARSVLP